MQVYVLGWWKDGRLDWGGQVDIWVVMVKGQVGIVKYTHTGEWFQEVKPNFFLSEGIVMLQYHMSKWRTMSE